MNIQIRKEQESDFLDVYKLNLAAFGQDSEPKLVELLRKVKHLSLNYL